MSRPGTIYVEPPGECELCGEFKELRPYGPNGENICFECGEKNPTITKKKMREFLFGEGVQ
jgi:hypothetical protein